MTSRGLSWDGCLNVRDLGGHRTQDGRETRFRSIVRADSVRQLSDAGWAALVDYGIRTVVDLRFHSELEADPPGTAPVDVVHIPLLGDPDGDHWTEIEAVGQAAPEPAAATRAVYLEFLERFRENFAATIAQVAAAPEGGVLVHCQGGKDRTGLVAALLLRLSEVDLDEIAADYASSASNLSTVLEPWIAAAPDEAERARRLRMSVTPAEAMRDVIVELERRYGSVPEYLRAGGATDEDLERARTRLVA